MKFVPESKLKGFKARGKVGERKAKLIPVSKLKGFKARGKVGERKAKLIPVSKAKGFKAGGGSSRGGVYSKVPKGSKVEVIQVRSKMGLSQSELARVIGYSLRSIAGWEVGKPLSEPARQKLVETERLSVALSAILPPGELGQWLRTPNPAFEGQMPIQVIERGEADRLWHMVFQIDAGVAS